MGGRTASSSQRRLARRSLAASALAVLSAAAEGHHSIAAVYDGSRRQSIEGIVTEFQFVNPHPFVIVAVAADTGEPQRWRLELDNRFELSAIGMTAETLKAGDRVVAAGSPGRTDPRTLYVLALDRPADGLRYEQVGTRPRIDTRSDR